MGRAQPRAVQSPDRDPLPRLAPDDSYHARRKGRVEGRVSEGAPMRTEARPTEFEPPYLHPDYRATVLRAPAERLVRLPDEWFHRSPGPAFGRIPVAAGDDDLTRQHQGEP